MAMRGFPGATSSGSRDVNGGSVIGGAPAVPPFDFATLPLTAYFMDRTNAPWRGKASAGSSGLHHLSPVTSVAGAPLNGHVPADYSHGGGGDLTLSSAASFIDPTTGIWSGAILFQANSAAPVVPGQDPYLYPSLMGVNEFAVYGVGFHAGGVFAWMYDGAWKLTPPAPCSTGAPHLFQWSYNGVTLKAWLDAAAGGPPSSSVAVTPGLGGFGGSLASALVRWGNGFQGVHQFDGEVALGLMALVTLGDADRLNIKLGVNAVFGESF